MAIYMWRDIPQWQPWVNTQWYRPLTSSTTIYDQSWNNRHLTKSGNVGFQVYADAGNIDCAYAPWALTYSSFPATNTVLFWTFIPTTTTGAITVAVIWWNYIYFNSTDKQIRYRYIWSWGSATYSSWFNCDIHWKRVLMWYTRDTSIPNITFFIRGNWVDSTETYSSYSVISSNTLTFSDGSFNTYLSAALAEDKVRTTQDVDNYYITTKANYWL